MPFRLTPIVEAVVNPAPGEEVVEVCDGLLDSGVVHDVPCDIRALPVENHDRVLEVVEVERLREVEVCYLRSNRSASSAILDLAHRRVAHQTGEKLTRCGIAPSVANV